MAADTPEPPNRRPGPSLATRFFLATSLLVAAAIAASVLITWIRGRQIAHDSAAQELRRASAVQIALQEQRLGQLRLIASIIADNPYFAEYVRIAIEDGETLSILDQLDERRNDLDFDFAMVLDPEGLVVARTDTPQREREDLAADPLIQVALEELEAAGVWAREGRLYDVVAVPVATAGYLDGFLIVGYALDEAMTVELRRSSGTEVALVSTGAQGPKTVSSTLDASLTEGLDMALRQRPDLLTGAAARGEDVPTTPLELGRQGWMAAVRRLDAADGAPIGATITLVSLDEALAPFRRIQTFLMLVGLGILAVALGVSFVLSRRILQPIRDLSGAARAAAGGDYDQEIRVERSDEVGQLAGAFSTLLADLREKRDMEVYITELARTLPDQELENVSAIPQATIAPPASREVVLLGAELRDVSSESSAGLDAQQTLDRLARELTPISQSVLQAGGRIEKVLGHRVVASFEGPDRGQRAMDAAAAIAAAERGTTALVAVSGRSATGSLILDREPEYTLAGPPVEQLESLLRVARADSVLISRGVRDQVERHLSAAGATTREVRSSVSKEPLYTVGTADLGPLVRREVSATVQLDDTRTPTHPSPPPPPPPVRTGTTTLAPGTLSGIGPGAVLGNRFEILSVLGAGGMGVVYKARDRSLQELVALKMLREDVWTDAERLQGLKDELKIARRIAHRNVLRTFDFGEVDGVPFITMEYVRGITLKKLLIESGKLPLSAGLRLARQLCHGLDAAHREHVLHRDIKPENMILEHTGNAKLMDFGIAKPIQRRPMRGESQAAIVGTPFYLAPEQLEGREADVRSDLYACGVVFYEIFTGELPYDFGKTLTEILAQKMREEPVPPSTRWPGIPPELERIIVRCLARQPDDRYPTTPDLLRDLERLRG